MKVLGFAYGAVAYIVFLGTFVYAIGFVSGWLVPRSIDGPMIATGAPADWAVNLGLLALFAVQHSTMARPAFKRWVTRIIPAELERSTFVLVASVALILLFACWRPLGPSIWSIEAGALANLVRGLCVLGWLVVLVSTFLIDHFELFGLKQAWALLRGRSVTPLEFQTPLFYSRMRHPIYLGFMIAFWATPHMTLGHLLFSIATSGYMLIAIQLEERDLIARHGETYRSYRERVPMLFPLLRRARG